MSSVKKFLALSLILTIGYFVASLFSKKEEPKKKLSSKPQKTQLHILRDSEVALQIQSESQQDQASNQGARTDAPKVIAPPVIRKNTTDGKIESPPIRVVKKPPTPEFQRTAPLVERQPRRSRLQTPLELTQSPEPAPTALPPSNEQSVQSHKIVDGDTLWGIAERYLGSRDLYQAIFSVNRDKLTAPDLLPIGKTIIIPSPSQAADFRDFDPNEE